MDMTAWVYLNVDDPLVAWLVYRGEMVSADTADSRAVSIWHTGAIYDALTDAIPTAAAEYRDELAIEAVRARRHPDCTSRLRGFYVFPDRDTAVRAGTWGGGFRPDLLAEIEIAPTGRVSQYDAQWISYLGTGAGPWIDRYLAGDPQSKAPIWEWIVEGRAVIYGTELRERARETVLGTWPTSRPLLEVARLGAWLGSDLGLITARATATPAGHRIEYWMNFADATNDAFLTRLDDLKRDHPDLVDFDALGDPEDSDPVKPDLTSRNFVVPTA
jgi:hypothetical protein